MDTDHERLAKLYQDDPAAFESERDRLINEAIEGTPESERAKLRSLQGTIDKTLTKAGDKRMEVLELMMNCNLTELARQMQNLTNILGGIK